MHESPPNVLIVDDEPPVCGMIRDAITAGGFRCVAVCEPLRAKQLLDDPGFDILLADVFMPGVSGLDLLAYTKQVCPRCRVILITGVSNTQNLAQALALGAYDYIQKPFGVADLVAAVRRAAEDEGSSQYLPLKAARAMEDELRLAQAALESIRALVQAVEAKDPYTRRHSEQVTHYAVSLARYAELAENQVESIRIAALVHDVGKIGIPDDVLTKPGSLTDDEFRHIRRHPAVGAEILEHISRFGREAQLIRYHHEKWDGTGYPDGLTGEETPLGARVINIADSMDAMLMRRTYKEPYPVDAMVGELVRCAGMQFDPELAAAAVEWCRDNPEKLILPGDESRAHLAAS